MLEKRRKTIEIEGEKREKRKKREKEKSQKIFVLH